MAIVTNQQATVIGVIAAVGIWYVSRKVGNVAEQAIDAVNPLNQDNMFSSGLNSAGEFVTGREGWRLGGAIYRGVDRFKGLYGESDEDKRREREESLKHQYAAIQRFETQGGGF